MSEQNKDRWVELRERATKVQDPDKLLELIKEISGILEVRQTQLRAEKARRRRHQNKNKKVREAQQLKAQGKSLNQLADALAVPKSTVWSWLTTQARTGLPQTEAPMSANACGCSRQR